MFQLFLWGGLDCTRSCLRLWEALNEIWKTNAGLFSFICSVTLKTNLLLMDGRIKSSCRDDHTELESCCMNEMFHHIITDHFQTHCTWYWLLILSHRSVAVMWRLGHSEAEVSRAELSYFNTVRSALGSSVMWWWGGCLFYL